MNVKSLLISLNQRQDNALVTALQGFIEQAISTGKITSKHDPEMLAHILIALIEGLED